MTALAAFLLAITAALVWWTCRVPTCDDDT